MIEYRIGLYDENKKLIGYKADTFWNLTKRPEHAKCHSLENDAIRAHLISNLNVVLGERFNPDKDDADFDPGKTIAALRGVTKKRFFGNFETMLIGYDTDGVEPVFTHRVFPEGVEPI